MTLSLLLVTLIAVGIVGLLLRSQGIRSVDSPLGETGHPVAPLPPPAPLPAPPDVRPHLKPGMYMFGQLWRWEAGRWHAEQSEKCEPVRSLAAARGMGVIAATWDAALVRRDETWRRAHDTGGRPRLIGAWAHPRQGLFVAGGSGTLVHARDGMSFRLVPVDDVMRRAALGAMWGDDERLFVSVGNGYIAHKQHTSDAWLVEDTGIRDVPMAGTMVKGRAHAAMQRGEIVRREDDGRWTIVHETKAQLHAIAYDAAHDVLYATSRAGILARQGGAWHLMEGSPVGAQALTFDGAALLVGSTSVARYEAGTWQLAAPGASGTIESMAMHEGVLFVGTSRFIEVS